MSHSWFGSFILFGNRSTSSNVVDWGSTCICDRHVYRRHDHLARSHDMKEVLVPSEWCLATKWGNLWRIPLKIYI